MGQRLHALAARRAARPRRQRQLVDGEGIRLAAAVELGDRAPDGVVQDSEGRPVRLHDLFGRSFVALYFTDARRHPEIPENEHPWLRHYVVSRWDPPRTSGIRNRALLDVGNGLTRRYGCPADTMVLVRPDDHIAAIQPMSRGAAQAAYRAAFAASQREAIPA